MLLIKNGRVIDPARKKERNADIVVKDGKIEKIYAEGTLPAEAEAAANQVLDAQGLVVAPGLVDVHVHFRDPGLTYKEDIHTGAAAAAKGGFTTVVCMANTKPIVDNEETLKYVLEEGKKTGIHVLSCAAVSKGFEGKERTDMEGLLKAGAAGFTDDGIPLMDGMFVKEAMEEAARLDTVLSFHEEDKTFIKQNCIFCKGKVMWCYLSPYICAHFLCQTYHFYRMTGTDMLDIDPCAGSQCDHTVSCYQGVLCQRRRTVNSQLVRHLTMVDAVLLDKSLIFLMEA